MNQIQTYWLVVFAIIILALAPYSYTHAADFNSAGDWGCKTAAISNLKNLANKPSSFFGLGDYSYKCKSSQIKPLWDQINSKQLALGNHSCEKSGQDSLGAGKGYFSNGGCKKGYGVFIRGGDTAIIVLNQYTSYKVGSSQYNFVVGKLNQISNMSSIQNIAFVFHEPIYPVKCTGSHCHPSVEKPVFKSTYEPLIKKYHALVIQAHTHLVAFGTFNGIRTAICGGGGEDSTSPSGQDFYTYVSKSMGYCSFHTENDKTIVQHIGTNNQVIHTHTWNKN